MATNKEREAAAPRPVFIPYYLYKAYRLLHHNLL